MKLVFSQLQWVSVMMWGKSAKGFNGKPKPPLLRCLLVSLSMLRLITHCLAKVMGMQQGSDRSVTDMGRRMHFPTTLACV